MENPFSRDPAVTVGVGADTAAFSGAMDDAISQLGSFKKAVGGVGVALGALATGALFKATRAAAEFEEQMIEVEKVTNPATARRMGDAIREMAGEMPIAHRELAKITAAAGRLGVTGEQNLREFTRVTAEMATATDLAAADAADSFARMSTLMNEPISNVRSIGDAINELSNTMAASSSEIVDAATRSSGVLTQLGLSSDQILGLNAAMNEVSSSSRIAGTQLRRFGQEIQDPGKVENLAAALDMSVKEFKAMRKNNPNQLIKTMARRFGEGGASADKLRSILSTTSRQTLAGLSQNLKSLNQAQKTANQQFREGGSLTAEYEAAASTFNAKVQVTKNRLHNVAIEIGQNLLPVLSKLLDIVNKGILAFSKLNSKSGGIVGTFGLVATALGGFAVAVGSAISMVGGMTAVVSGLGTAISVLSGPIGWAILAIAGLAAAWQSNFLNIQGHTKNFVGFLKQSMAFLQTNIIQPFLQWMTQMWDQHFSGIAAEVQKTAAVWQSTIAGFIQWAKPYVQVFLEGVRLTWAEWGDEIVAVTRFAFDTIKGYAEFVLSTMSAFIRTTLAILRGDWQGAWDIIRTYLEDTLTGILNFSKQWGSRFLGWIRGVVNDVIGYFQDLYHRLIGGSIVPQIYAEILGATRRFVGDMVSRVKTGLSKMVTAVWQKLSSFKSAVKGMVGAGKRAITEKSSEFKDAGSSLASSVASGIRSRISRIRNAARDAMSAARSYLPGSDADHGPLSDLTASGQALPETFAQGIDAAQYRVRRAMSSIGDHTQDYIDYGSVTRKRSRSPTSISSGGDSIGITVNVSGGADGKQIGRDVADELRSRGFGN